jgi:conjugation system TraG family ATPase
MEQIYLSEYYPILHTKGNVCLSNSGDTFLCYVLELPEVFTLSKKDYATIHDFWFRMLKHLPNNTVIHKQDVFLKELFNGEELESNTFLQKATKKQFENREYLRHFSLLFIGNTSNSSLKKNNLSNPFRKLEKIDTIKADKKLKDEFIDDVEKAIEFINSSRYIKAIPFGDDEIHDYIKSYFNGFESDKKVDTTTNVKIKTSSKEYNVIGVGDKRVGMFSVNNTKQLPDYVDIFKLDTDFSSKKFDIYKGFAEDFSFKLPFNHIYNQIIFITNQQKEKSELESQKENLFGARGFSADNETASEELSDYLKDLSKDENRMIVYGHTNIIYYADTNSEFESYTNKVSTIFKNMEYKASYPNKHTIKDLYIKSLFTYSPRLTKLQVYKTELHIALTSYINTTSYRNDDDGVLFSDRVFNIPTRRDVRDLEKKRIKAWNFKVLAPTGEGKSVLMQHIFRQQLEKGKKIVIFDIGASFKKLAYLLPEDKSLFLSYEQGQGLGINPFQLNDVIPSVQKLNELAVFIYKIWKPAKEITNEVKTTLRKIIESYYKATSGNYDLHNFYAFVKLNKDDLLEHLSIEKRFFDIEDFLLYCSDFVEKGQYSFLFKGGSQKLQNIKDKDLVVFEFDKAKDDEVVLAILMELASYAIRDIIWQDKTKDGIIFYDEAAKFFKNPAILDNVIFQYQAIRKQSGSVGIALQSPSQLPKNDDVDAMIDNTQVLYILFNEKGYQPIVDRYSLSDHQHSLLKSITPNLKAKRPYTEFGLIIGKEIWIMRLELSKESYYTFQTDGREYEEIMQLFEKEKKTLPTNLAMEKAIELHIKQN